MPSSTSLHAISPALFLLVPLFLILLALQPNPLHRPAGPLLAQLALTLIAALAVLAAALGLAALPTAEAIIEALFVFILESSVVYIIYSLSSYRLYVNALVFLLSSATLLSFLSTLLPVHHAVPPAISPALLVLFSLVSFPLVSYLIFPPKRISSRGCHHHNSSQVPQDVSDSPCGLTKSPSLIPFPSSSPSASSAEKLTQNSEGNFYEADLEGTTILGDNFARPYPLKVPTLLFIAQFLFLFSSIFNLCSLFSTADQTSALKTAQTALLIISSFFAIFAYSQYVRYDHDRVPEQAIESCDSSNQPSSYAKGVYANINSKNDATHSLSKLNSHSTYELSARQSQYSLTPSASMSFRVKAIEVGSVNSSFTLDSRHGAPSSPSHVKDSETSNGNTYAPSTSLQPQLTALPATVTAASQYPQPVTEIARLRVRVDEESFNGAGTSQDCVTVSAAEYANEIYMPTPLRVSPSSLLFPDDIAPATADLQKYVSQKPASDVDSDVVATILYAESKKTPTLVHRDSAWSIASLPSNPVVPTLSSSNSSLALSTICMKPRSHKSSTSSRQMSLAKCVPLDVLSRNMEMAENKALQPGDSVKDRRDRQALLRVDNGIGSRSRSISAASTMTVYEDLEWVASRHDTGKEKKHDNFIFGQGQDRRDKAQDQGQKGDRFHLQTESRRQRSRVLKIGRVMRGRSLSFSLLNNLIGRQKEEEEVEESHEPISPSSSISFSSSSMLSSFSMSLSRSPASPVSVRSVVESEPASPSSPKIDGSGKKGRYYWTQRKPKKDKKKSRSASDLQQGRVQDQLEEGPADFMDLRDPFAPPDLGTRGSITTLDRYGRSPDGKDMWRSSSRLAAGSPSPVIGQKMSEWGNLPLVADSPTPSVLSLGQERFRKTSAGAVVNSRGKVKTRNTAQSPPLAMREGQSNARRLKGGDRQRASSDCSRCSSDERLRAGLAFGQQEDQRRNMDASPVPCSEGLDVEEALLAQRLLMRLDLASPVSL